MNKRGKHLITFYLKMLNKKLTITSDKKTKNPTSIFAL